MPCGSFNCPGSDPRPPKLRMYFVCLLVLIHVERSVAVADIDVAVWRDGDIRGVVAFRSAVRCRPVEVDVRRSLDLPDNLTLRRRLEDDRLQLGLRRHLGIGGIDRQIQVLVVPFAPDVQTVGDAAKFLSPRAHELAVTIEHHHRVRALARRVHGVMDVDVPLGVLDNAVRVAPFQVRRQRAPVVDGLVGMGASAEHGRFAPCLVLRAEEDGGKNRRCRRGGEEFSTCGFQ